MPDTLPELLPKRVYVTQDVGNTVARIGLGLTLYLDEPGYWAFGGAERWARRFLEIVPREELCFYRSSARPGARRIDAAEQEILVRELDASRGGRGMRHLMQITLTDDPGAPRRGFIYREANPERSPRAGYLQFFFGNDLASDELLALAIEIAARAPIVSGVGGWCARSNPRLAQAAYRELLALSRRYIGVDIQRPDAHSLRAREGVSSVGWLNLLGPELRERVVLDTSDPQLTPMAFGSNLLLKAGPRPELGDCNSMNYPDAQLAAARCLRPLFAELSPFPADFGESALTQRWQHRFTSPSEWT